MAAKGFSTVLLGCGAARGAAVVLSWSLIAAAAVAGQGTLHRLVDVRSERKMKLRLH